MLKIKGKKSYYTFDKNKENYNENYSENTLPPLPIINKKGILSFSNWKLKYNNTIEDLCTEFTNAMFTLNSEQFICHINMPCLKLDFIKKLYETSHNSSKYYP